jgi:hypothetical protein
MLDLFGALVETPLGTAFFALAAAASIYGRAAALASITTGGMVGSLLGLTAATGAAGSGMSKLNAQMLATQRIGRVAVGSLLLLGGAFTDLDDKAGLANTTMGAGMGAMVAGLKGAGIGAVVGMLLDIVDAAGRVDEAITDAYQAIDAGTRGGMQSSLKTLYAELEALDDFTFSNLGVKTFSNLFGGGDQRAKELR